MKSARDREDRGNRWLAAVNGINLDSQGETAYDFVEERKRKLQAEQQGKSFEQFEFDELGLDIEIEE